MIEDEEDIVMEKFYIDKGEIDDIEQMRRLARRTFNYKTMKRQYIRRLKQFTLSFLFAGL